MIKRNPTKLLSVKDESIDTKTFEFEGRLNTSPGQFIMLTDYENGEKPFSFSSVKEDSFCLTIKKRGEVTSALFQKAVGNVLYFSGPHGNKFILPEDKDTKILIAGGGCGTAPLLYLLESMLSNGYADINFINGARSKEDLLFSKHLSNLKINCVNITDDGSDGEAILLPQAIENEMQKEKYNYLYCAGPELAMKACYDVIKHKNISAQFLLERYMKCGVGICGQCTLDPSGIRLCVEGPVVDKSILDTLTEFGNYTRDVYGKRVDFNSCGI